MADASSFAGVEGCWELVRTEPETDMGDRVQMEFTPSGSLTYGTLQGDTWQLMLLTYRVENGSELVTNQPSAPSEERTAFSVSPSGALQLKFGGINCWFERVAAVAFASQLSRARH